MPLFQDPFTRADTNNDLGADYTVAVGVGLGITNNAAYPNAVDNSRGNRLTGTTQANDQYCQMTIAAGAGTGIYYSLYLRTSGADATFNGYKVSIGGTNELYITEVTNGSSVDIASGTFAFTTGVVLRAEAEGTTLRLKIDGTTRLTTTDGSFTSGNTGLELYNGANGTVTDIRVDDFEAGDIGAGSTVTKTPATGNLSLGGKAVLTDAFTAVRIRDVLINESGQPIANATNLTLKVWYSGYVAGPADFSRNSQTTDANGTTSWSISTGTLTAGQAIFYVAQDSLSFSNYTCARMIPSYESS